MNIKLNNYNNLEITQGGLFILYHKKGYVRSIDIMEEMRQFLREKGIFSSIISTDDILNGINTRRRFKSLDIFHFAYRLQQKINGGKIENRKNRSALKGGRR